MQFYIATMCLNSKIRKANRTASQNNLEYDLIVGPNEYTYTFLEILLPELIHFPCLSITHSTFFPFTYPTNGDWIQHVPKHNTVPGCRNAGSNEMKESF